MSVTAEVREALRMPSLWEPPLQQMPFAVHLAKGRAGSPKIVQRHNSEQEEDPVVAPPVESTATPVNGHTKSTTEVPRSQNHHEESIARQPYDYVAASPSKGIREELIKGFNAWFDVPPSTLEHITRAIGILHTASLLIDDIQDDSPLRRGRPAAHTIYGVPQTINSANYMYFAAIRELQTLHSPHVLFIATSELLQLHLGQGMDLYWRDMLQCPTPAAYFAMVTQKTGGLFRLAVRLLAAESHRPLLEGIVPLVEALGVVFQIRDDYQNLVSSEYRDKKGSCEDLTEGKFSYPVIHCVQADAEAGSQLVQILKLRSTDEGVKRVALECLERTGSLEHTRGLILREIARAKGLVDALGEATEGVLETRGLHGLLDRLANGL